jgi:hypothetical protein
MKSKPYPALLQTSYMSKEIKKMIQKSCETIPLTLRQVPVQIQRLGIMNFKIK